MDIQDWQARMKKLGMPYDKMSYYAYLNHCPACHEKPAAKCTHCNNEKTYTAYVAYIEKRKTLNFKKSVSKALELYQEVEKEKRAHKQIEEENALLRKKLEEYETTVLHRVNTCIAELTRLEASLPLLDTKVTEKIRIPLAKVVAWLHTVKDINKENKTKPLKGEK